MFNLSICRHCGSLATVSARSRVYNGIRITEGCCLATLEEDIDCPQCGPVTQPVERDAPPPAAYHDDAQA